MSQDSENPRIRRIADLITQVTSLGSASGLVGADIYSGEQNELWLLRRRRNRQVYTPGESLITNSAELIASTLHNKYSAEGIHIRTVPLGYRTPRELLSELGITNPEPFTLPFFEETPKP